MEYVLMVIDRQDILIHVGSPETFDRELLADYAVNGMTIKTITFKEYQKFEYRLYEKITI